ncbi:MAG TPA: hypothetical protein VFX16_08550 [Pseudonocardiaceae bacterium]|nr:hypothetical protein [Pseudonocardiaceae bacterium]
MPRPPRYVDPGSLPPVPDPETGEPRPPRAPGRASAKPARFDRSRVSDPELAPVPPAGQGPVLAWYRTTRRYAVQVGAGGALAVAVLLWLRAGFHVFWITYWWVWLSIAVIGVLVGYTQLRGHDQCAAGVEWLSGRRSWVRTYELVKVKSLLAIGTPLISMEDSGGRRLSVPLTALQSDRLLWDLVYNGILHSVIAGNAETNGAVHVHLRLPYRSPYS